MPSCTQHLLVEDPLAIRNYPHNSLPYTEGYFLGQNVTFIDVSVIIAVHRFTKLDNILYAKVSQRRLARQCNQYQSSAHLAAASVRRRALDRNAMTVVSQRLAESRLLKAQLKRFEGCDPFSRAGAAQFGLNVSGISCCLGFALNLRYLGITTDIAASEHSRFSNAISDYFGVYGYSDAARLCPRNAGRSVKRMCKNDTLIAYPA